MRWQTPIEACWDVFSGYEFDAHLSAAANMHDAIAAIGRALAESEVLFRAPLAESVRVDPESGEVLPVVTIATDNGGPFRSFTFEVFIAAHPSAAPRAHAGQDRKVVRLPIGGQGAPVALLVHKAS